MENKRKQFKELWSSLETFRHEWCEEGERCKRCVFGYSNGKCHVNAVHAIAGVQIKYIEEASDGEAAFKGGE